MESATALAKISSLMEDLNFKDLQRLESIAQLKVKQAKSRRCYLLELPAELRNHIWQYVLVMPEPIGIYQFIKNKEYCTCHRIYCKVHGWTSYTAPLLGTCRQIRGEGSEMFYAENAFTFASCEGIRAWVSRVGIANERMVREMQWDDYDGHDVEKGRERLLKALQLVLDSHHLWIGATQREGKMSRKTRVNMFEVKPQTGVEGEWRVDSRPKIPRWLADLFAAEPA